MKIILILIILLALPVSATWAKIFDRDGALLDTCTEEEAISILKSFGHYPDTLTHYRQIDTTTGGRLYRHSRFTTIRSDTTIDTTWQKKIPVYLTPDEHKRLMEMLKPKDTGYSLMWDSDFTEPFDTFGLSIHEKIPERGEHFIPIIFINTPGLIGCADTIWVDTTDPKTYLRVTTSGQPLNRFYGTGIENDWKYEITIEMITDGIERGRGYALQFKGYDDPAPDSFGIFDSAFKKADEKFKNSGDSIIPIKEE